MPDRARRHRSESYSITIAGLLTRRSDLSAEATKLRDRLAEIRGDLEAVDRVLRSLGHAGDLDAAMPPKRREAIFGRGELSRAILDVLREASAPMSTREIARLVFAGAGQDVTGRAMTPSQVRTVSKALNNLASSGSVRGEVDTRGGRVWVVKL